MLFRAIASAAGRYSAVLFRSWPGWKGIGLSAGLVLTMAVQPLQAAQVLHLNTQTATATGAGATGKPTIATLNIPSGKNRALFIWGTFERDHCSPADTASGLCVSGNTAGTGLGDNWPEPRVGTPPATTSNNQITAQVIGPGGTINKQNALVIGGTPSGDTRFITISTSPNGSPAGTAFFSLGSFHIVLFESEINTLLGGAASGNVSITFPDVTVPSGAGDEAMLIASVYQNVEQTVTGFVRNATATAQVTTGTAGNFSLAPAAYDAGQAPDEADDGKLVMGANASTEGFLLPAGHVALATLSTTNAAGEYDTPNGNINNEPNGFSGGAYFRNGGGTPGSLYTLQAAGAAATLVYGGTNASFLLESDNADVGDAPVSYGNPSHTITGIRLGASADADAALLNNAGATGDDVNNTDDENGVTLTPLLPIGYTTVVPVSIQNASGVLNAWFDWNADGDFNDVGEQMVSDQAVAVGTVNLNIAVPLGAAIGPTFARFRVCTSSAATAPLDNCNTPVSTVQSGEVEDYQFQVNRALVLNKITVGGAGGPFGFALTNTAQATGSVTTSAANTVTQVDGDTGIAGTQPFTIVSPTTAVTINENSLPAGWSLTGATCVNAASAPVGSLSGSTYTLTGAEIAASVSFTCTFTNTKLPILRLQKSLPNGRFAPADQFTLSIAGTGGPATVTTTGAGSTATGTATLNPGAVGALYTLSETGASGANLANYSTTYTCSNALAGGQTPSGSTTSFTLTAVAGDDLTCVFTNALAPLLAMNKTASASPWIVGVAASYTLQVTNIGAVATTAAATITDTIPAGLTIGTLPAGCTAAGQTVTCTIASGLAASASTSFVIPVTPTLAAMPSVTNTASVSGGGDATCPAASRCTSTVGPTIVNTPELTLVKTASASPWTVGVAASYTLQLTNSGSASTTAASAITDTIPAGLTIGTLPAGCSAAGQTVTCTVASGLAASASTSFVIPVTPTAAAIPSVTNTATASGGGDVGCPAASRCTSTVGPTTVNGVPQLTLTKTASASPWTAGVAASYTLQLTNSGSASTTAASAITDTIPAGLTIGTLPAGCSAAGQIVTCTVASGLAASASTSFVIPVTPTAAAIPSVTNTATASGGGDAGCPAASRCTSTVGPTTVNGVPQLTLVKTASASPWTVGVAASYTLQLTNTGSAPTTATATITDTIPAGLTIGTLPAGCTAVGQAVTCTVASGLAVSASTSFVIPVTPTAAAIPSVTNTATASGGGDATCPAASRCTSTVGPTTVNGLPQLSLIKTASASPWTVGVAASYTLQLTNTGSAATTAVATITDTIPAGLTIGTLPAGCTAAGQTVTCTVASGLAVSASTSFVIPVTPTAAAIPSVTNTATTSGGGDAGCPAASRCTGTVGPTTVNGAPQLTMTKTASASPWTVAVAASYTLQVTNTGSAATTAVSTITDTIPAGLAIGTLPIGCTAVAQTVTCTIASGLAVSASTSFVIPVTPTAVAVPSVTNTASVSGGGDAGCPAALRCIDTEGPTPVNTPELTLTKTASASPWTVGVAASYTLQVTNTGTAATTAAATITDTIPAGLTIGTLPAGCTAAGQAVTCTIASGLAVSANVSFVIPVTPTAAAVPSVTNTATVGGGGDAGCPAAPRCSDTEGPTGVTTPELTLTKTASASPWTVGVAASYTLQVTNTGTTATTALATIIDAIPAGLTIGTLPAGCTAVGQTVTCTIASGLAVSASISFVIPVTPTAAAVPSVTNTATVSGGGDAGCPAAPRCSDTEGPTGVNTPELTLVKTASASPWTVGVAASYTLQVTNTGTAATTAVATITDTIPAGLTIGTLPAGCTAAGQ
ncbi:MAG: hypothetical protein JNN30_03490, partial [Rhodanobacteraceae bacterium]|nr:hypothetical protein [Rhodanobacteraceae bacterium]